MRLCAPDAECDGHENHVPNDAHHVHLSSLSYTKKGLSMTTDISFSTKMIYENKKDMAMDDVPSNPEASRLCPPSVTALRNPREPSAEEIAATKLELTSPGYLNAKVTHEVHMARQGGFHI